MDSLIPFLIFGFIVFRWLRKAGNAAKRAQQDDATGKPRDAQEIIREILSTNADHSGDAPTPIPRTFMTDEEPSGLFEENKWRRQLFIVSLGIGAAYLVYLLVI